LRREKRIRETPNETPSAQLAMRLRR
jgi:hypothetical protein